MSSRHFLKIDDNADKKNNVIIAMDNIKDRKTILLKNVYYNLAFPAKFAPYIA